MSIMHTMQAISQYKPTEYTGEIVVILPAKKVALYIVPNKNNNPAYFSGIIRAYQTGTRYKVPSIDYVDIKDLFLKIQQFEQGFEVPLPRSNFKSTIKKTKPQIINLDEPDPIISVVNTPITNTITTETHDPIISIWQRIINWIHSW